MLDGTQTMRHLFINELVRLNNQPALMLRAIPPPPEKFSGSRKRLERFSRTENFGSISSRPVVRGYFEAVATDFPARIHPRRRYVNSTEVAAFTGRARFLFGIFRQKKKVAISVNKNGGRILTLEWLDYLPKPPARDPRAGSMILRYGATCTAALAVTPKAAGV